MAENNNEITNSFKKLSNISILGIVFACIYVVAVAAIIAIYYWPRNTEEIDPDPDYVEPGPNIPDDDGGDGTTHTHTYVYEQIEGDKENHLVVCTDGDYETMEAHEYTTETIDPTCEEFGSITYTCDKCGFTYSEEISPLGHDLVYTSVGANGHIGKCTRCDYTTGLEDHTIVSFTYEEYYCYDDICSLCGEVVVEGDHEIVPMVFDTFSPTEDRYDGTPRVHTTNLVPFIYVRNSTSIDVNVQVQVEDRLGYVFADARSGYEVEKCSCGCLDDCVYMYEESDERCTCDSSCEFCNSLHYYGTSINNHYKPHLYYSGTEYDFDDFSDRYIPNDVIEFENDTVLSVPANSNLYIYTCLDWISDIDGCTGTDADAFDTFMGNNLETLFYCMDYIVLN